MQKKETKIKDCVIIQPDVYEDRRGLFFESYNREKFVALGIADEFVQDNQSTSSAGVLRGMHFQAEPKQMTKLVRCSRGKVFDVAVDMRKDSPSFKQWIGVELSEENHSMLYVPAGCAHGFYAITDCDLLYKCTALFDKLLDGGFAWNDPEIAVEWPLTGEPILSDRDKQQPSFASICAYS
jgi:dTDP-4-dehydrorhamnose 3,5-epimerase